jgi:hypothetical protein
MAISLVVPEDRGRFVASAPALDFRPTRQAAVLCGRAGDCCREDCPFHSGPEGPALVSVALARPVARTRRLSGLSGSGRAADPAPAFARRPAVRSSDFPLPPRGGSDHPARAGASSPHTPLRLYENGGALSSTTRRRPCSPASGCHARRANPASPCNAPILRGFLLLSLLTGAPASARMPAAQNPSTRSLGGPAFPAGWPRRRLVAGESGAEALIHFGGAAQGLTGTHPREARRATHDLQAGGARRASRSPTPCSAPVTQFRRGLRGATMASIGLPVLGPGAPRATERRAGGRALSRQPGSRAAARAPRAGQTAAGSHIRGSPVFGLLPLAARRRQRHRLQSDLPGRPYGRLGGRLGPRP